MCSPKDHWIPWMLLRNVEILTLMFIPGVDLAAYFNHENQGTTDITTLSMPSNVQIANLMYNSLGVAGIPANYFNAQDFPNLKRMWLRNNDLDDAAVPDLCFTGIASSLLGLKMQYNLLTTIRKDQFKGLYLLDEIWLNHNSIHTVQSGKACS